MTFLHIIQLLFNIFFHPSLPGSHWPSPPRLCLFYFVLRVSRILYRFRTERTFVFFPHYCHLKSFLCFISLTGYLWASPFLCFFCWRAFVFHHSRQIPSVPVSDEDYSLARSRSSPVSPRASEQYHSLMGLLRKQHEVNSAFLCLDGSVLPELFKIRTYCCIILKDLVNVLIIFICLHRNAWAAVRILWSWAACPRLCGKRDFCFLIWFF